MCRSLFLLVLTLIAPASGAQEGQECLKDKDCDKAHGIYCSHEDKPGVEVNSCSPGECKCLRGEPVAPSFKGWEGDECLSHRACDKAQGLYCSNETKPGFEVNSCFPGECKCLSGEHVALASAKEGAECLTHNGCDKAKGLYCAHEEKPGLEVNSCSPGECKCLRGEHVALAPAKEGEECLSNKDCDKAKGIYCGHEKKPGLEINSCHPGECKCLRGEPEVHVEGHDEL